MSHKEVLLKNIHQELDLIPDVYLFNLFNIIHTFRENLPDTYQSIYEKNISNLYGSWKGNETADELISVIYSSRNNYDNEVSL